MNPLFTQTIDYAHDLNPEQFEAVSNPDGPLLIIAGAGSGKTRTIVYRVAWLVEQGVDPSSILLVTFTRKAAEEMLSRAGTLLGGVGLSVAGGTFHSIGNLLLRRYGSQLGFTSYSIMDQADAVDAVDHAKQLLSLSKEDAKKLPKSRTIFEIMSKAVSFKEDVSRTIDKRYSHFSEATDLISRIQRGYADHKREHNLMDYDDLLTNTIRLLSECEEIRTKVSNRWKHILVDEYQDTNILQSDIVKLLAYTHDNVMVVGDDSQSIYSFRGADIKNIMEFPQVYANARVVRLEQNYRSTAPILRVTNAILQNTSIGYKKRLYTEKDDGPLPILARTTSEKSQSAFVVKCVRELYTHDIPLSDIAVLFRAGYHSFDLEGELTRSGISYVKYGGMKFLESAHIKDMLAYLRVVHNAKDTLSWSRILKLLPGVGPKKSLALAKEFIARGIPESANDMPSAYKKLAKDLQPLLDTLNEVMRQNGSLSEKIDRIGKHYFDFLKVNYDNYPKRIKDLDTVADMAAGYTSLTAFLNDMVLDPPDHDSGEFGGDTLTLSTIHSSKGLEWHTVILIWAAEGRIPSPMAMNSPDELEEERRLLYVATTRAKHNLVVVSPTSFMDRRLGYVPVSASRFFMELPRELFREHTV